jgi:hypothetical protein
MPLKNNIALKHFAILLFSFELLAPVLLTAQSEFYDEPSGKSIHQSSSLFILFSTLISEEANGEEERDGKEHGKSFLILQNFFSDSSSDLSLRLIGNPINHGFSSHSLTGTSLCTLLRVFRI